MVFEDVADACGHGALHKMLRTFCGQVGTCSARLLIARFEAPCEAPSISYMVHDVLDDQLVTRGSTGPGSLGSAPRRRSGMKPMTTRRPQRSLCIVCEKQNTLVAHRLHVVHVIRRHHTCSCSCEASTPITDYNPWVLAWYGSMVRRGQEILLLVTLPRRCADSRDHIHGAQGDT